jgi:PAS domain S-box-containing protein
MVLLHSTLAAAESQWPITASGHHPAFSIFSPQIEGNKSATINEPGHPDIGLMDNNRGHIHLQEHKEIFWGGFIIFSCYSLLLMAMWINTLRRRRIEKELLRNQYYLSKAQEIGKIGTWELDVLSKRLIWTDESCRIFGIPPGNQMNYDLFLEKVHPDDREYVKQKSHAATQGEAYDIEHRIVVAGKTKWVREKADVSFDENGNAVSAIGLVQDITERLEAEQALRESEERFRSIFESAAAAMSILSADGDFLQVNPASCQLSGYNKKEFSRLKLIDITHPAEQSKNRAYFVEILSGKRKLASYENRYLHKDGSTIWGNTTLAPVRDSKGNLQCIVCLAQDISERKRAEEALHYALNKAEEARDKIEAILKSVADGLIFTDMENRIILMSASAEAMLNKKATELFMQPLNTAIGGISSQVFTPAMADNGNDITLELDATDGQQEKGRSIQVKSSVVLGKSGDREGVITLLRDVSRERELDQMKNEFISTAAHELRTPLTSVKGYSELLLNDKGFSEQERKEFLGIINEKSDVLARIVGDLLNLSRVESGRVISLRKAPQDLGPALGKQISRYRDEWQTHRFELDLPDNLPLLLLDLDKFTQVMENLLSNAVKYSPDESLIRTVCEISATQLRISVKDQGYGMTAEQRERVFDKFYRVNASNTAKEGLGLGMSIAKNIVEAHGGRIWVESELNRGTTVHFTIPRFIERQESPEENQE